MKIFPIIVLILFFISCKGQIREDDKKTNQVPDMINQNHSEIPEDAFQMNLGFVDNPVWIWAKYDHNLNLESIDYNHIYGINYYDENGYVETLYYEEDREEKDVNRINFADYILKPYPGNGTLQLIGKNADTLLLFNVLENKALSGSFKGKEYQRIPTVSINGKNEKVSDYDVRINYALKKGLFYEVTIISDQGIGKYTFKSNCPLENDFDLSYYDLTNNRIYLLDKNHYLEKVDL